MLIKTKFLGEVDINESDIISFEYGLPGFQNLKKFVLIPLDDHLSLAVLQSTEEVEVGFVVAYPFVFKKDYAFDISEEDKEDLKIEKEEDVVAYAIITLMETFQQSTLNLLAPIVINSGKKIGKQIVLQDSSLYPLRYPIGEMEGSVK